jgi:S1-C subfamily serine protease
MQSQPATTVDSLVELTIIAMRAGDKVELTYARSGQAHQTTVTLGNHPF